jgi:hypothetical protein
MASTLICFHVFCVCVGVFGNRIQSDLFTELARHTAVYAQTFQIFPVYPVPFHLTIALDQEDSHFFEIEMPEQTPVRLSEADSPPIRWNGGFRLDRYRRQGQSGARAASIEDDLALAEYARAIGAHFLAGSDVERMVVRLKAFRPPDWRAGATGLNRGVLASESFYSQVYEADVWQDANGRTHVHKRVPRGESAPPVTGETPNA